VALEIERKFLVRGTSWRTHATAVPLRQGYLCTGKTCTVRVRTEGRRATLTVKGLRRGITRREFEYPIPVAEARAMLNGLCLRHLIEKTRYTVRVGRHDWQIDRFRGENRGLVVAEIELTKPGVPALETSRAGVVKNPGSVAGRKEPPWPPSRFDSEPMPASASSRERRRWRMPYA
jgi:adenylate cyclase